MIKHWLNTSIKFDLCLDPNVIVFGILNSKSVNMPINTIYISAKYFIYRRARNNRRMNVFEYQNSLKQFTKSKSTCPELKRITVIFVKTGSVSRTYF